MQVGFGLYPVIVKKFASEKKADPLVFSFYRDFCCFPLLFLCALIAERKIMFPRIKMLVVCVLSGSVMTFDPFLVSVLGVHDTWLAGHVWKSGSKLVIVVYKGTSV